MLNSKQSIQTKNQKRKEKQKEKMKKILVKELQNPKYTSLLYFIFYRTQTPIPNPPYITTLKLI